MQAMNGVTPLHGAAMNGHSEVVNCLLAAGCDPDIQNSNGNTALHLAASKGIQVPQSDLSLQRQDVGGKAAPTLKFHCTDQGSLVGHGISIYTLTNGRVQSAKHDAQTITLFWRCSGCAIFKARQAWHSSKQEPWDLYPHNGN